MNKAIAIKYNKSLPAPFVLAKGKNGIARKIIDIAEKHDIPLMEMEDLTENLFSLEVGGLIPEELFEIIAEILAFVYELQEGE